MANKPSHTAAAWTEVEYSSLCISPYLSTPVFVPKETSFYLCREGGERKPTRLTFVVFKAQEASDDEWEDDPMLGNIMAEKVLAWLKIDEPVAKGIAIGSSSHAIGTAKAMEMGVVEGATSGLSIVVSGILTVVGASLFALFL